MPGPARQQKIKKMNNYHSKILLVKLKIMIEKTVFILHINMYSLSAVFTGHESAGIIAGVSVCARPPGHTCKYRPAGTGGEIFSTLKW